MSLTQPSPHSILRGDSPTDKIIYAFMGRGLTLDQYRGAIEAEGYAWTPALHGRVNALVEFINNNLGIGITKEELRQNYENSITNSKFSQDLLHAFARSQMGYFRREIMSLKENPPGWSIPKILDILKGGPATGGETIEQRRACRRLFSEDIGTSRDGFYHRYLALCSQRHWDNEGLNYKFHGGFLVKTSIHANDSSSHGMARSTVEPVNQAVVQNYVPPHHAAPLLHLQSMQQDSMNTFTFLQGGLDPTRMSSVRNSMPFSEYDMARYSNYCYMDVPIEFGGYNAICNQMDTVQHVNQDNGTIMNYSPGERVFSNSEEMAANPKELEHKLSSQQLRSEFDRTEIEGLNQKVRCLEGSAGFYKSEIERLNQKVRSLEVVLQRFTQSLTPSAEN